MSYQSRIVCRKADLAGLSSEWERLYRARPQRQLQHRLEHIALEAEEMPMRPSGWTGEDGLMVAALYEGETLIGAAPFLLQDWTWRCRLGYASVGSFPVRRAVLCGTDWLGPDTPAAQEALLEAVLHAKVPYQVLFIEGLPAESDLLRLLRRSPQVGREFWVDTLAGATPRRLVDLRGSLDAYLEKFSGRTRRTLKYKAKRLAGAMRHGMVLRRFTHEDDVPSFIKLAQRVSALSWQGRNLGHSITPEAYLRKLKTTATHGWLRSYVLQNGDTPVAFVLGLLGEGTFYYERAGYDPAWAAYHPGNVLLYMILEDLCADGAPKTVDFGSGDNEYKRMFSTRTYDEVSIRLVRKSAATLVPYVTNTACFAGSAMVRKGLDHFALREKVRRLLRGANAPEMQLEARGAPGEAAEVAPEAMCEVNAEAAPRAAQEVARAPGP
ncbi:GNAT family N-acetyltransferase [Sorangium sp. So ce131]|uniref:GNAT family N-acetyltransferase n=1 Tax=Sorangium sp. So ce131 TaxID=3133282 RepID=UPI003F5F40DE